MAKSKTALPMVINQRPSVSSVGGALEGAERNNRETLLWNASRLSPDQIVNRVKVDADARGRETVTNDGYAQGLIDINRDSIVGSQYRLNLQPNWNVLQRITGSKSFDDTWAEEVQLVVEEKFNLIAESNSCWLDASRTMTFTGMVRMAISGFVYTGEVLGVAEWIREVDRPFATAVQMVSPFRLSNPDFVPDDKNLRRGVRMDFRGVPLAYYIQTAYPTEFFDPNYLTWQAIPAQKPWGRKQFIHIKDSIQPSQTRGIAGIVAILKEMRMTKNFRDVTLQNAVINASYAATIESELPSEVIAQAMGSAASGSAMDGFTGILAEYLNVLRSYIGEANAIAVDGAKMPHLFPGTKLNTRPLGTPGGVGTDFEASLLRHISAGLGVSYEEFANDWTKTNYSSGRASALKTWKHMSARKTFVADRFANDVFALWFEEEMNSGMIPLPSGYNASLFYEPYVKDALTYCDWIGASRGQIDEMKETQAAMLRIKGGMSTYEMEIAKLGGDWRKIFRQIAREQKFAKDLGISIDVGSAQKDGSASGQKTLQKTKGTGTGKAAASLIKAIKAMPAPQITVNPTPRRKMMTKNIEHDDRGRVTKFEQEEVDA